MITKTKHMYKKTLVILLLCFTAIAVSLALALPWFRDKQAVPRPRTAKETLDEAPVSQRPEETLKQMLRRTIKQEFLPSEYKITHSVGEAPFGEDLDYYLAEWSKEKARFSAYVGYSRITPKELVEYITLITVKEPSLSGKELGQRFLNFLPNEKWHRYAPEEGGEVETFSAISTTNDNKVYVCIASFNFSEPVIFEAFPNEFIKNAAIIGYGVCMPNHPWYTHFEDFQKYYFRDVCPQR